jgi:hypothetical protein
VPTSGEEGDHVRKTRLGDGSRVHDEDEPSQRREEEALEGTKPPLRSRRAPAVGPGSADEEQRDEDRGVSDRRERVVLAERDQPPPHGVEDGRDQEAEAGEEPQPLLEQA